MGVFQFLLLLYLIKIVVNMFFHFAKRPLRPVRWKQGNSKGLSVDILLPMYNEEKVILDVMANLLHVHGPDFRIIVVDDGSTDDSYHLVSTHYGGHPKIRLIHKANGGKASALNRALVESDTDIVVCIDADTLVRPDVLEKLIPYFTDEKVGAVSGYIKVGNRVNFLTEMQNVEYITIPDSDRNIFECVNGILVVPGALGAFRRDTVKSLGGFKSDALAEDCDITLRILCNGFRIRNAPDAIAFTEAPTTVRMFIKQRTRWTVGLIQGLLRHGKEFVFQTDISFAWLVIWYTWLYRIAFPIFASILDYYFIFLVLSSNTTGVWEYYLLYNILEVMVSVFVLVRCRESTVWTWLVFLKIVYRHLLLCSYVHILLRCLSGQLYGWGKIPRQGNVKLD